MNTDTITKKKNSQPHANEDEVYLHFNGGREGIRQRFGMQIQAALSKISGFEAGQLANHAGLCDAEIPKICSGDFKVINRQLVEALADPLSLNIKDALQEPINLDPDTLARWVEKAKEEQFMSIGGADSTAWDPLKSAKLFLMLQAVESL